MGSVTEADITNEVRAILELYSKPNCNLVSVYGHGRLPQSTYYYIDMELCNYNLAYYLRTNPSLQSTCKNSDFLTIRQEMLTYLGLLNQVGSGLAYIHCRKEVHRDIKPENSLATMYKLAKL